MNKFVKVIGLCFFLACSHLSFCQNLPLTENPDEFIKNLQAMFAAANNAGVRKTGDDFGAVWAGGKLSQGQQKQIISIGLKMQKNKYKATPVFDNFFAAISHAVNTKNISSGELDNLLTVTEKVLDKIVPNNNAVFRYFNFLRLFFEKDALHASNYNKLLVDGGIYSFDYIEIKDPVMLEESITEEKPAEEDNSKWFSDWDSSKADSVANQLNNAVALTADIIQPQIEGPVIKLDNVTLTIVTNYDSTSITGTKGSFLFLTETFVGDGGKFDWSAAGLEPSKTYVELNKYNFKVKSPSLEAEKVKLFYPDMTDQPVEGVMEYKSKKHKNTDDAQYPRFKSYSNKIEVKNIGKNISYTGGFALGGNKVYSSSLNDEPSVIKVTIDGIPKFKSSSTRFLLGDSIISAQRASVTLYQKTDTIFHPVIQLKYNKNTGDLTLKKDEGGFKYMPFYASAFKMNITADILRWNINQDSLDISILGARNQIPAVFESSDYYNDGNFDELKGLYPFHPLQLAVNYSNTVKSRTFYTADVAAKNKLNPKTVKAAMVELYQRGFINMNNATGEITLKDKAFHFVDSKKNKKDFDDVMIPSLISSKPNATLNLSKDQMTVRGVKEFYLSDSLNTYINPTNAEITLLKNRNFTFSGTINSGNFQYHGSNFQFKYDSFLVSMQLIDSIKLMVETVDDKGKKVRKQLDNQLEFSSGTLYINDPQNKSNRRKLPQYPIFDATTGASVYFDGKEINKGVYDKSLSFEVPPFKIDSLSSSNPSAIGFEGTFKSKGMLPDFKEKLKVLPDRSLGFTHKLPPEGYPIYNGVYKGDGEMNVLSMTQKGLRGNGVIEYLTSSLYSKEFIFYIDSVKTDGTSVDIKGGVLEGASFPQATVKNYRMKWLPKRDSLFVVNLKEPFQFYEKTATLNGRINITTKGLFGSGTLLSRGSDAKSKFFTFREKEYLGRQATFAIRSDNPAKPAFAGDNVKLDFNLEENYAKISPEIAGTAALSFPYSQYKSSINEAIWKLDEKKIVMSNPEGSDVSQSYFYSTRKDQDSLVFNAASAEYDIKKLSLNIKGVPFIKVADAKIIPSKGEVTILENANFQPLKEADLLIDTLNEYHSLYDGNLDIVSRSKFTGNATYRYVNTVKDTFSIKFDRFELEKQDTKKRAIKMQTVSSGNISVEDKFLIAPKIYYRGKATMYANKKALELDGFVKLEMQKFPDYDRWIVYKRNQDVDEIVIDFNNNITDNQRKLTAGLHIDSESNGLYFTFANEKHKPIDPDIFLGSGMLSYNLESKQFRLIDSLKAHGKSFEGNSITYDEENSLLKFEGKLNLINDYKEFNAITSGSGVVKIDSGVYNLNTLLGLTYNIPTKALDRLAANMKEVTENINSPEATSDKTDLLYKIASIAGNNAAGFYDEKSTSGRVPLSTVSPKFLKTFLLSDVNFKWSESSKSFYSVGKVGLSNIMKTDINARINGFIEIRKLPSSSEVVSVYLEASPETYYFFRYEGSKLWVFSSDDKFNSAVESKSKGESVKPGQYTFIMSNMAEMLTYINRFRKNYLGIDEPYKFEGTKEVVEEDVKVEETKKQTDDGF